MKVLALVVLATVSLGGAASAGDGRLEINQTCVDHPCVFGDPIGFPIFLPAGGNFVLTSDIVLPGPGEYAISLPDHATLDLAGFRIVGTTTCNGEPVTSCINTDAGSYGILLGDAAAIRNGTIAGVGDSCVLTADGNRIENMVLEQCGGDGIEINTGNDAILIRDSQIRRNLRHGVNLSAGNGAIGTLIRGSTIRGNGAKGVFATNLLLLDNLITRNKGLGLDMLASGGVAGFAGNFLALNNGSTLTELSGGFEVGPNFCYTGCP